MTRYVTCYQKQYVICRDTAPSLSCYLIQHKYNIAVRRARRQTDEISKAYNEARRAQLNKTWCKAGAAKISPSAKKESHAEKEIASICNSVDML